jgi:hypothetical protein
MAALLTNMTWDDMLKSASDPVVEDEEMSRPNSPLSVDHFDIFAGGNDDDISDEIEEIEKMDIVYKKASVKKRPIKVTNLTETKAKTKRRYRVPVAYVGQEKLDVMERNRLAAAKSRNKTSTKITELEIRVDRYEKDILEKDRLIAELREEMQILKTV